ncbi:MAG: SIR2 family protein [Ignavibacterium sp.]|nr:SIR2 family protein [Ignavibacterium sp.]
MFDFIYNVAPIDYQYHIRFFSNLRSLLNNQLQPVWIFTTNYDLLLERAASEVNMKMKNSFEGISKRYFNITDYDFVTGKITSGKTFQQLKEPIFNLVKLHGSISWLKENNKIIEQFDFSHLSLDQHCMILPRRKKIFETLDSPYDQLFRYSSNVLGRKCRFLVTFGYSYRDQHINQTILLPKLQDGSLRIFAFLKEETVELDQFKLFPNFNYLVETKYKLDGSEHIENSNLWDFKEFVNLLS